MNQFRKLPLWGTSFLLVLGLHVGVALWAMFWRVKPPPLVLPPAAPVMLAQLEPLPPPPPPPPPTPVQVVQAESPLVPKLAEAPKAVLAVAKVKPKPEPKKAEPKKVEPKKIEPKKPVVPKPPEESQAKAPAPPQTAPSNSTAQSTATSTASSSTSSSAASGGSQAGSSAAATAQAKASWQGQLLGHLARYKKYPEAAKRVERPGVKKVNRLRFVINAAGQVLSYELVGLSGSELLDKATLEMIRQAQPLPPPPPELLNNGTLEIIAPLVYELKRDRNAEE